MQNISQITIQFTEGISAAYPTIVSFLRDYLPSLGVQMSHIASGMDLSPSQLSQKLSESEGTSARFTSIDLDNLYRILTPKQSQPIIAYQIEKVLGGQFELDALKIRVAELEAAK